MTKPATTNKPNRITTKLENFPLALAPLCQLNHWVLWRWELRKNVWTKPPYMAANPRRKAKNNDPATWAPYPTAVETLKRTNGTMDGIGFALPDTPFDVVDLDHCLDPKTGTVDKWAAGWVNAANGAYVERTPSGAGLRIIGLGSGEKLHRKWSVKSAREDAAIEIYRGCERYITVTGAQLGECRELAQLDLLEKIQAHYDTKQTDAGFDFNKAGASAKLPKVDYDTVIKDGAPADCSDVSALFHSVVGHLAAKMSIDAIVDERSRWPKGIARRYAGRLRGEVERSFEKWQRKRKIHVDESAIEPEEPLEWESRDKKGLPRPTRTNARRALRALGIECRYDAFHDKLLIESKTVKHISNLDHSALVLCAKIHKAFKFDPGPGYTLDAIVQLCRENEFDPIVDYLNALKWDGTPRLDRWLITYLGAEDTELNREFGRLTLIAAVRRARRPGTKFDPIVVLEGPMGTQKSMAIEVLAGSENFSDQTILGARDREAQELLAGIWLFEIAELSNIRRTEVEHIKAFASRTVDRARPAYGRARMDQPRRCILFATTNNDQYLKEADRRFWPVKTTTIDIAALKRDRNQLWAEAAAKEPGTSIVLQRELWDAANVEQEARQEHDPWDDKLTGATGIIEQDEERVPSSDLLETALGIHISKQRDVDYKRLGRCMRRLGWDGPKKIMVGGIQVKGYTRPAKRK
jgi:Virulence-associated protein E